MCKQGSTIIMWITHIIICYIVKSYSNMCKQGSTRIIWITHIIICYILIHLHGCCGFFSYTYCHVIIYKLYDYVYGLT